MILDTYHVFYHPESNTYLDEYWKLVPSWRMAKKLGPNDELPKWTGLLPHHPLNNLRRVKIEVVQEESL